MKIAIGNDHAAVEMKNTIMDYLKGKGIEVVNVGTDTSERFDYPIAGYRVAKLVAAGEADGGVLICGTGVGIGLAANKVRGVEWSMTRPQPERRAAPVESSAAPGMVSQPATMRSLP